METYFDLLPDDLLLIILRENMILKDVNSNFKRVFDDMIKRISDGVIQPMEYFTPVTNECMVNRSWYNFTVEGIDVSNEYFELHEFLRKIRNCNDTITYFYDTYFYYQGYITIIYQTQIEFYYDLMELAGISSGEIPSKICYLYIKGSWGSTVSTFSIYVDVTWKNFWNIKLDQVDRDILMRRNNYMETMT